MERVPGLAVLNKLVGVWRSGRCIILRFFVFPIVFLNGSSFVSFLFVRFLEKITGGNVDRLSIHQLLHSRAQNRGREKNMMVALFDMPRIHYLV